MILTREECKDRIGAFADTPELMAWLLDAAEHADAAQHEYYLRELHVHLDGLYQLARSLDTHLFHDDDKNKD